MAGKTEAALAGGRRQRFSFNQQNSFADSTAHANLQPQSTGGRRRAQPEAILHRAVVEHLRLRAKPDVLWLHVPNGERRDKVTGAILKRMGVLAGASDLLLWHNGNSFALELKAPRGRLSDAQLDFLARFNDAGGHSACTEGLD